MVTGSQVTVTLPLGFTVTQVSTGVVVALTVEENSNERNTIQTVIIVNGVLMSGGIPDSK